MVNSINHESNVCHVNVFLLLVAAQSLQADWLALFIFLGQTLILIPAKSNTYCSHWFHSEGHSPFFAASMFAVHHHGVTREEAGMNSSGPEGAGGGLLALPTVDDLLKPGEPPTARTSHIQPRRRARAGAGAEGPDHPTSPSLS